MTRVYLPGTLRLLAEWASEDAVTVMGQAHAVTPALRSYFSDADDEELEYAAMVEAAFSSVRLLAADPDAPRRRVVIAADVQLGITPTENEGYPISAVLLPGKVPMSDVASFHIDEADAESDVAAAALAMPSADTGDQEALLVVDAAEGHDLLWFDVAELDEIVGDAGEGARPESGATPAE